MTSKPKILIVGSFIMDLISTTYRLPAEGETTFGVDFSTAPGGKGANQAVQAALLEADVTMVGKVGNDIFGEKLINSASKAGIDISSVIKDKNAPTGVGNIILELKDGQKSRNRILLIPGANMTLSTEDVEFLRNEIESYDIVMLQLEIPMEVNEAVADMAYEKNVPVMLNSAPSAPLSGAFLKKITYICPNEYEAADLTGIHIKTNENSVDFDSVRVAAAVLLNKGVKNVIITLGSNGVAFINAEKFIYQPCIDIVQVKDPTAAGDSFIGAFCTSICSGMTEEEAILFASFAATITVSRMGAQPSLASKKEVINLMHTQGESDWKQVCEL